jgi:large subunit ribosomal protein L3
MKMAGQMGNNWRQLRGLKIWRINREYNILYLSGPTMPGPNHSFLRIQDSCLPKQKYKKDLDENPPPFPTYFKKGEDESKEDVDVFDDQLYNFADPSLKFETFETKTLTKREGAKIAKIK